MFSISVALAQPDLYIAGLKTEQSLFFDGILVGTRNVENLAPGETRTLEYFGVPQISGQFVLRAVADVEGVVKEIDERNNERNLNTSVIDFEILAPVYVDPFKVELKDLPPLDSFPIDNPKDGINWEWIKMPKPCVGGAGTDTFILLRRGSENKLLLYLEAGGACLDFNTCQPYPSGTIITLYPNILAPLLYRYGIFDVNNPLNPFRNWTMILVPYSTGDVHMGNRVVKYYSTQGEKVVYHVGYVNAIVAMRWANQSNFEKIVVAGSSAGGFGAILHFYTAKDIFKKPVVGISDAGPGIEANVSSPFRMSNVIERWGSLKNFPEEALDYVLGKDLLRFVEYALEKCEDCKFALFEDQYDTVIAQGFQGYSPEDYRAKLLKLTEEIREKYPKQFFTYLPLEDQHKISGDRFYSLRVDGLSPCRWISEILNETEIDQQITPEERSPGFELLLSILSLALLFVLRK
ncbi:MAG: pectin acetylesterase-family hydrolase [Archaeoglobaceae archaeon]|nr:pectin acetylesterase-family hydrolase [Archaeoglobaceae archaeon]MDW8128312.1 pectin acetylesterase-family hydrolase [Archaeoglobaceae archaeon]